MKDFVSFVTDCQSMHFMPTILLKDNIYGVCVPQFQLAYILNTTHPSRKNLVIFCHELHYMWW